MQSIKIYSPITLFNFMKDNIHYGYVSKFNTIHKQIEPNSFYSNYRLQSPKKLLKSKYGVCWDQVELERYYFEKFNIKFKTIFTIQLTEPLFPTHTYLIYFENNKYFYFENAFEIYKGIHGGFNNIQEILLKIENQMYKVNNGNYKFEHYEYVKPRYNINCKYFLEKIDKSIIK